jgi:hypothetical protein
VKLAVSIQAGLLLFALSLTGCGSVLTQEEIAAYGTRTYSAPKEKLVEDISVVLKGMGYEVVVADAGKGIVKTSRKEIGSQTRTSGIRGKSTVSASSVSTSYYRQYLVQVSDAGKGALTVRVTPKVFIGERDVSEDSVWNIDGAGGERELWQSFFSELESTL